MLSRGAAARVDLNADLPTYDQDDLDDMDDAPDSELEETEEKVVDQASAARTIVELQAEIETLKQLEVLALKVRQSGTDRKWDELSKLLQNNSEMFDAQGHRRKLIIFTEHRDTLNYLKEKIFSVLGRAEAIVTIQGGMGREQRKTAEQQFTQNKDVEVLVATDAAGEGINLQRAHLMVNYDLPWNPNRLEQRFGRIHRIGQTEVCHLWNLVAKETREGEVYHRLLEKLEEERRALGGQVFDVLGRVTFEDRPLRQLLLDAIRYGDKPEVRARLTQVINTSLDRKQLQLLLEERALARDSMDSRRVHKIKEDMERAEARRLQPHFIASFFMEAFRLLGGTIREREPKRYEVTHVPTVVRSRDRAIGMREAVLPKYERITFEKDEITVQGKPLADFVCPGHGLLDSTTDLIIERYRDLLKQGSILVDDNDPSDKIRVLVYLEHSVQDARTDSLGQRRVVSKQLQFVEIDADGKSQSAGYAPYLNYRPLTKEEQGVIDKIVIPNWVREELETRVLSHAAEHLVPAHFEEVRHRREELVERTIAAVKDRLTKEIAHWDHRAEELREQESTGKVNAKLNSTLARHRADDLTARMQDRLLKLEQERKLSPLPPVVMGGALVIPVGVLAKLLGKPAQPATFGFEKARVEALAMAAVMQAERMLGFDPRDVSAIKCGYDIESSIPGTGCLRFIEVKGRVEGSATVTVTKNEILTALNKPDEFILAFVEIQGEKSVARYIRRPFQREPDFGVTSVNYNLAELLVRAKDPS